jgi:hypothetical protein
MLIKDLCKASRVCTKDLLASPVGQLSYIIDCMNAGLQILDAKAKLRNYSLPVLSNQEILQNEILLNKVSYVYSEINSINEVINLC